MLHQRYVVLTFIFFSILASITIQSASSAAVVQFGIQDSIVLGFVQVSTLIAIGCGILMFFGMMRYTKAVIYTDECIDELFKVTWPSRDETVRASSVVVITTLFVSGLLSLYDLLWKNVAAYFLYGAATGS